MPLCCELTQTSKLKLATKLTRTVYGWMARQVSLMADDISSRVPRSSRSLTFIAQNINFFRIFLWLLQTKTRHSSMIELTSDLISLVWDLRIFFRSLQTVFTQFNTYNTFCFDGMELILLRVLFGVSMLEGTFIYYVTSLSRHFDLKNFS